mmetsp:Transcript_25949/g.38336  ORF Transcript_25949/g.38336 Transcript_25949/m.38336 type:complete len:113 (+) Transcript_25949:281-619(+)
MRLCDYIGVKTIYRICVCDCCTRSSNFQDDPDRQLIQVIRAFFAAGMGDIGLELAVGVNRSMDESVEQSDKVRFIPNISCERTGELSSVSSSESSIKFGLFRFLDLSFSFLS